MTFTRAIMISICRLSVLISSNLLSILSISVVVNNKSLNISFFTSFSQQCCKDGILLKIIKKMVMVGLFHFTRTSCERSWLIYFFLIIQITISTCIFKVDASLFQKNSPSLSSSTIVTFRFLGGVILSYSLKKMGNNCRIFLTNIII